MPNFHPYYPLYISDHYRVGVFGRVTLEASGLYLRLLPIGWDSTRCGYLTDQHGKGIPLAALANQCGVDPSHLDALLVELLQCGAVQKTSDNLLRITLMAPEANCVTAKRRELLRQRVARHRYRKRAEQTCNAVTRYTDNDNDNSFVVNSVNSDITATNVSTTNNATYGNGNGNGRKKPANSGISGDFQQEFNFEAELKAQIAKLLNKYPKIGNAKMAGDAIRLALHRTKFDELSLAVDRFSDSVAGTERKFVTAPEKWFQQGMYLDYLGERWEAFQQAQVVEGAKRAGKIVYAPEDITALSFEEMDKLIGDLYCKCAAESDFELECQMMQHPSRTPEQTREFIKKMRIDDHRDTPEQIKQYITEHRMSVLKQAMQKKGCIVLSHPKNKKAAAHV